MCPPRLVLAPLEGHHAEVKGWQDLVSSTKFLVSHLTSARKSKPCSLSLSPAFLGRVWKKKKYVSMQCHLLKLCSFWACLAFEGCLPLQSQLLHGHRVPREGDPGREAGRATEGRVTGGLCGLSFPLRNISQAGGSLGLELASPRDSRPWRAAAWGALLHPRPELLGTAKEEHSVGGSRRQTRKASLTPCTPLCPCSVCPSPTRTLCASLTILIPEPLKKSQKGRELGWDKDR